MDGSSAGRLPHTPAEGFSASGPDYHVWDSDRREGMAWAAELERARPPKRAKISSR